MRCAAALFLLVVCPLHVFSQESGVAEDRLRELEELDELESQLPPERPPERVTPREPPEAPEPVVRRPGDTGKSDLVTKGPASGEPGGEAAIRYRSQYFFRGLRFSRNDVLQLEGSLWYKGFKLRGFTNYDCGPDEFNEADGTLSYTYALSDDTIIEGGYTYYGYPHREFEDTQEFFAGIQQEWIVDASIYGYYDFDEGDGAIWEFGLGKHFRYGKVDPYVRATATLNARYFNNDTEFSHGILSAGLPVHLTDYLTVFGDLNYQWGWQGWTEDDWFASAGVKLRF